MSRTVFCQNLQKEADGLDFQLYPGEVGNVFLTTLVKKHGVTGRRSKPC